MLRREIIRKCYQYYSTRIIGAFLLLMVSGVQAGMLPLDRIHPYLTTMKLVCPGKGFITLLGPRENFIPSAEVSFCKERGATLLFSLYGGSLDHNGLVGDSGYVCMHNIAFNGNCFFPDDCFPFVDGVDYFSIDLNNYIHAPELCSPY